MKHILSAQQFNADMLGEIFDHADYMKDQLENDRAELARKHGGMMVATLFYEPSTRTRLSFESAAQRLGAGVLSTENAAEFSSTIKGETLEDTIRVVDRMADIIVLRHEDDDSAERAASVSSVPVISGGAGANEHPTQALLDIYTIRQRLGRTEDLSIVIGGDLKHGRTARSIARLVALYPGNQLTFVSTEELKIGQDIKDMLGGQQVTFKETDDLPGSLADADVVYWTRLQKERLKDLSVVDNFKITGKELDLMRPDVIIMHPLPRTSEIHPEVDNDPRAAYFDQVTSGLHIRMAILDRLLTEN